MRSMHTMTAAAVAALLGLAFVSGAADAQTLPRQIILEMETEIKYPGEGWEPECRQQWRYTFRGGRIFEEYPSMFCFGIQHGKEGVGLVFEANGSTTSVVRDVQERGSKTVRRSNGDTYSAWGDMVWRDFETITTTSSSVTQNRIEIEYVVRIRGSWEGQNGKLERFDDEYSPSKIILEISRSGCKLVERVFSLSRVKYRVKSSTCRIVW